MSFFLLNAHIMHEMLDSGAGNLLYFLCILCGEEDFFQWSSNPGDGMLSERYHLHSASSQLERGNGLGLFLWVFFPCFKVGRIKDYHV